MTDFVSDRQIMARYKRLRDGNPIAGKTPQQVQNWIANQTDANAVLQMIAEVLVIQQMQIEQLEALNRDGE